MRSIRIPLGLLLCVVAGPAAASGCDVAVTYQHPERYTDIDEGRGSRTDPARNRHLKALSAWLPKAACACLPEGSRLTLSFTNIDLAGDYEPAVSAAGDELRIVKDVYPPRLAFDYTYTPADASAARNGSAQLKDIAFLMSSNRIADGELRFEKKLLQDWLRQALCPAH